MIVIPFEPVHLELIDLQEKQIIFDEVIKDKNYAIGLKEMGRAWSLIDEDSLNCIMCGGIIDAGAGRGIVWSLLSKHARHNMLKCTRETLKRLNGFKRLELTVSFPEAARWAEMMGFTCETPNGMKNYINDETHYLYSRIQ